MKPANELQLELPCFSGTEAYHRWSILFTQYVLTDGAKYLAEEAEAYWLMDAIASWHQYTKTEPFQAWTLHRAGMGATLTCESDEGCVIAQQDFAWTDFPLDEVMLFCENAGEYFVIMLPSEY